MDVYASITLLICLLMVAMTIHVLTYSGFNKEQKAWFVSTFLAVVFCSAAEFAVHCGYYDAKFAVPLTILTLLQFSLSPVLAMFFSGALGLPRQGRIAGTFFGVTLLTEIICAPFGWIFRFDETGYHRGPAFIVYEIFYFLSLAYLIVALVMIGRRFRRRDMSTILFVLFVLIAGIVPMTVFGLHVAYAAIGISACLCYIFYNDLVQQDTLADFIKGKEQIRQMQEHIISGLASLIESRDTDTGEHVTRTSALVKMIAEEAVAQGVYADVIDERFIDRLYTLAPLHDVGKIVVSDSILQKPGKLTPEEFEEMKKHASMGGAVVRQILSGITDEEIVNFASDIAMYHHEKWNGQGYPRGLSGEGIPLSARIMAIADVYDALVSRRCYKEPFSFEKAMSIMEEGAGVHFDPNLMKVFLDNKENYRRFCDKPQNSVDATTA